MTGYQIKVEFVILPYCVLAQLSIFCETHDTCNLGRGFQSQGLVETVLKVAEAVYILIGIVSLNIFLVFHHRLDFSHEFLFALGVLVEVEQQVGCRYGNGFGPCYRKCHNFINNLVVVVLEEVV